MELWNEHGLVMRTAIGLSLTVPGIGELWSRTAKLFVTAITAVLERAGAGAGPGPRDAPAMAHALCCWSGRLWLGLREAGRHGGEGRLCYVGKTTEISTTAPSRSRRHSPGSRGPAAPCPARHLLGASSRPGLAVVAAA